MTDVQKQYADYINSSAGVNAYQAFKQVVYGADDALVAGLFGALAEIFPMIPHRPIDILDVGGGDGQRLRALTKIMSNLQIKWTATLIDPSQPLVDMAQRQAKHRTYIEAYRTRLDQFWVQEQFDLFLLIHSIFCFPDSGYLVRIRKMMRAGGMIVVQSNAADSFLAGLKSITDRRFHMSNSRREIDQVLEDFDRVGLRTTVTQVSFPVADVFRDDQLTLRGRQILEWIALGPLDELPARAIRAVKQYFQEHCTEGGFTEKEVIVVAM